MISISGFTSERFYPTPIYPDFGGPQAIQRPLLGLQIKLLEDLLDLDCSTVADQTKTEIETRDTIREVLACLKEAVPVAFRNAYLYDIAPQLGYRCSCRLRGEYVMTANDFAFAKQHDDVIAWHSTICQINDCGPVEIPYRAILPQKVEGLLCPGRHLSADNVAIDWLNLIPQCVGTGLQTGKAVRRLRPV